LPDKGVKFSTLFQHTQVICALEDVGRDEVIKRLVELIAATGTLSDIGEACRLVVQREDLAPSVLAPGVAVPHARVAGLHELQVAVGTSRGGLPFGPSGAPVKLVVLILAPERDPGAYLQAQAALARTLMGEEDFVPRLAELNTPGAVWRAFDAEGTRLPDYVAAGHMMARKFPSLRDTDPLSRAIDEFYRLRVNELPVVDRDGDLVGVVTENELLKVCMPEHITWMEDLSPILHFEPFSQILRNEERTWLSDIMSEDYAVLSEDAPAVQVAREIIRLEVSRVYVTRGRKLVGLITIQDFLNKVLRD
jgi:mannitol/fructose-specific phosphotransferase system IIA component (Ntr-type)/CBS domain-containing protein